MVCVIPEREICNPSLLALRVLKCVFVKTLIPVGIENVLDCYDLKLLRLELGEDNGFLVQTPPRGGVVLVNRNHHPHRQRFTAGHELYHYLTNERNERHANMFTAELLMPPFAVHRIWEEINGWASARACAVKILAHRFSVSQQAAAIRLKELGL